MLEGSSFIWADENGFECCCIWCLHVRIVVPCRVVAVVPHCFTYRLVVASVSEYTVSLIAMIGMVMTEFSALLPVVACAASWVLPLLSY